MQLWNWNLKKNSGLNGIRTHDLCGTSAVPYQLSYQASWELATLLVRLHVDGKQEHCTGIAEVDGFGFNFTIVYITHISQLCI